MRGPIAGLLIAALAACSHAVEGMSVSYRPQLLYADVSPKLRIQGSGFVGVASDYSFTIVPPLAGKYNVSLSSSSVISLGLARGATWASVPDAELGTTVFLMSLKYQGTEQLSAPAQVATIIQTPAVKRGDDKIVYMSGTPRFLINGTGFRSKTLSLVFEPPLVRDVDYVLQARSDVCVQLTLKTGKSWHSDKEPGPLKLKLINTGAGDLRIDAKVRAVF